MRLDNATTRTTVPANPLRLAARVLRSIASFVRRKPLGGVGALLVIASLATALLAPLLAPYDPSDILPGKLFLSPRTGFPAGTDNLGRDQLSRIIWGSQVSVYVGLTAVALGTTFGSLLGLVSAYLGGGFDTLLQRLVDALMAFPTLVLALIIAATLGASVNNVVLAIAVVLIPQSSRVVRSVALSVKEAQYVDAARAVGASHARVLFLHILPQCTAPYLIIATAGIGFAIVVEASISFLGAGPPPPTATWGNMLSGAARQFAERAPWMVLFPGIAISLTVFGFNLLGDALRDVLDPRLRN
ncbi:MAG: ABC transporter permease [Dehalococcoidia bacterium]|nr:ABC transporter permease [Dehalococcoidia bacterium]